MKRADIESAPAGTQRNNGYVSAMLLIATVAVPVTGNGGSAQLYEARHAPHWGYSGQAGPSHWADMGGEFALCGSGKRQSPVDIRGANPQALYPLDFQYRPEWHLLKVISWCNQIVTKDFLANSLPACLCKVGVWMRRLGNCTNLAISSAILNH